MGKFIYTNDLPMYEKYELIDRIKVYLWNHRKI